MYCPNCGTEYEGNFCPKCGTPAPVINNEYKTNSDYGRQSFPSTQYNSIPPKKKKRKFPNIVIIIVILIAVVCFLSTGKKGKKVQKAQTETVSVTKAEEKTTSTLQAESKAIKAEEKAMSFSSSLDDSNSSVISFYDMSFRIPDRFGDKASNSTDDVYYFYDTSFGDDKIMMLTLLYSEVDITEEEYKSVKDTFADSFENGVEKNFSNVKNKKKQKIEMAGRNGFIYSFEGNANDLAVLLQYAFIYHDGGIYSVGIMKSKEISEDTTDILHDIIGAAKIGYIMDSQNETSNTDIDTQLEEGIRPEIKEAIDSYEAFFDDYVALMKKYKNNPADISILSEYMEYMSKLSDMEKKFKAIEDQDLTTDEALYYAEVSLRIEKKMLEVLK